MTRFIFFSGKGGAGRTSMACTHAVSYADTDTGKCTLIATTDPASNLADVFEQEIGHQVTSIACVPDLFAVEIDRDKATQEYIVPMAVIPLLPKEFKGLRMLAQSGLQFYGMERVTA